MVVDQGSFSRFCTASESICFLDDVHIYLFLIQRTFAAHVDFIRLDNLAFNLIDHLLLEFRFHLIIINILIML
jgi:hypothetical protein